MNYSLWRTYLPNLTHFCCSAMTGNQVWGLIPLSSWLKWHRGSSELSKTASGNIAIQCLCCLLSKEYKGPMPSSFPRACLRSETKNRCYFLRLVYFNYCAIAEQVAFVCVQDLSSTKMWRKKNCLQIFYRWLCILLLIDYLQCTVAITWCHASFLINL